MKHTSMIRLFMSLAVMSFLPGCAAGDMPDEGEDNPPADSTSSELSTEVDAKDESALVRSIETLADGTISESIYTPAKGVTPEELVKRLNESGETNVSLVRGAEAADAPAVAPCVNGTARSWPSSHYCFVRWSTGGLPRPKILFNDRSADHWPVGRAATTWNDGTPGLDVSRRAYVNSCPSGVHCVTVNSAGYGQTGWVGKTHRELNPTEYNYKSAYILLNESYSLTSAERRNVACHEIGHVLGLDHNTSTSSCLYYQVGSAQTPYSHDFGLLNRYY